MWNCSQALHEKYPVLEALSPDIAIIQECANKKILKNKAPEFVFNELVWDGINPNKGLGVFSFGDSKIEKEIVRNELGYIFIPIHLSNPINANMLAVWAFNHRNPIDSSINTSTVIKSYSEFLNHPRAIVAGDFNHNVIWDSQFPKHKFIDTLDAMKSLSLRSVYHLQENEAFGKEKKATFFWQKNLSKTYHIDYIFMSDSLCSSEYRLDIKDPNDFIKLSDHVPLVLDIAF